LNASRRSLLCSNIDHSSQSVQSFPRNGHSRRTHAVLYYIERAQRNGAHPARRSVLQRQPSNCARGRKSLHLEGWGRQQGLTQLGFSVDYVLRTENAGQDSICVLYALKPALADCLPALSFVVCRSDRGFSAPNPGGAAVNAIIQENAMSDDAHD